jgi:hypothetical protein
MRKQSIGLFLCLLSTGAWAQEFEVEYLGDLLDTLLWQPLAETSGDFVPDHEVLDTIWTATDRLVVLKEIQRDRVWIKHAIEGRQVFVDPFEHVLPAHLPVDGIIEHIDLDGDGKEEHVMKWENVVGHTGWEHAIYEREWGLVILDPGCTRSISLRTRAEREEWGTEYAEAADTIPYDQRDVLSTWGETHCEQRSILLQAQQILIGCLKECAGRGAPERCPDAAFSLRPMGLVRDH